MPDAIACPCCGATVTLDACDSHTRWYRCQQCYTTTELDVDAYMDARRKGEA